MTGDGAAILGGCLLVSGSLVGTALIVRRTVTDAASAVKDGAWRGYAASLNFSVRPPAAKAQKPAEPDPAARARSNGHASSPAPVTALADGEYLTRSQAAGRLGVGESTFRKHPERWPLLEYVEQHGGNGHRARLVTAASLNEQLASLNGEVTP